MDLIISDLEGASNNETSSPSVSLLSLSAHSGTFSKQIPEDRDIVPLDTFTNKVESAAFKSGIDVALVYLFGECVGVSVRH